MSPQLEAFYEVVIAHPRAESFLISVNTAKQLLYDLFALPNAWTMYPIGSPPRHTLSFFGKTVNMSPGVPDDAMLPIYTVNFHDLHELTRGTQ